MWTLSSRGKEILYSIIAMSMVVLLVLFCVLAFKTLQYSSHHPGGAVHNDSKVHLQKLVTLDHHLHNHRDASDSSTHEPQTTKTTDENETNQMYVVVPKLGHMLNYLTQTRHHQLASCVSQFSFPECRQLEGVTRVIVAWSYSRGFDNELNLNLFTNQEVQKFLTRHFYAKPVVLVPDGFKDFYSDWLVVRFHFEECEVTHGAWRCDFDFFDGKARTPLEGEFQAGMDYLARAITSSFHFK
jgi:hypothetical protein